MKKFAILALIALAVPSCSIGPRNPAVNASVDIQERAQLVLNKYGYDIDARSLTEGQAVRISRIGTQLPRSQGRAKIDAALRNL